MIESVQAVDDWQFRRLDFRYHVADDHSDRFTFRTIGSVALSGEFRGCMTAIVASRGALAGRLELRFPR